MFNKNKDELLKKLENGVKKIFETNEYKRYLNVMSNFHNYSYNNNLLISMQKPDATLVNSYTGWKKSKRYVNKGEKSIKIIAPRPYTVDKFIEIDSRDKKGNIIKDDKDNKIKEKKQIKENRLSFTTVSVFDISQTDGEPLPQPFKINELNGFVKDKTTILNALKKTAKIPIIFKDIEGRANGYYSPNDQKIVVKNNLSDLHTIKTTIHEVSHKLLHNPNKIEANTTRKTAEVQAESVAYVVSQKLGLDTSDYSFGYIAGWSTGKEMDELKSSLDKIQKTADKIINDIEKEFELLKDKNINNTNISSKINKAITLYNKQPISKNKSMEKEIR